MSTGAHNSIEDQANYWAVEAAYGEMAPDSRAELNAWLATHPRHRGAFARARAALRLMESAVIEAHMTSALPTPVTSAPVSANDNGRGGDGIAPGSLRRKRSWWSGRAVAGSAALAATVAILLAMDVSVLALFRQSTPAATEEILRLTDGSIATLYNGAKIEVVLSADHRRIALLRGEATFEVAKDSSRPFVVRSGDVHAQATGTIFSVSRVGLKGGKVEVMEGSVLVWPRDERDQAVLVRAGDIVTLNPGPKQPTPKATAAPPSAPPALAQISLDNVSIKSAAARFNRVNTTQIIIADPEIEDIRIVGLFRANDVEKFAQAAATLSGGKIKHEDGAIVVIMK